VRHCSILLVLALLAGCAGTLHDRLDLGDGRTIEPGMTGSQVEEALGRPDTVTHDRGCLFACRFWWQSPSRDGKSEWAWTDRDPVVVVWLRRDRVIGMGTLPKDGAFPGPYAAESYRDSARFGVAPFATDFPWFGNPGERSVLDEMQETLFYGKRPRRRY